jgi:DNA-binding NarL/FixJ family response regulator
VTYDLIVRSSPLMARLRGLTERQREALQGALAGDTEAEIADDLQLSALETLRELRAVYAALGVTRRYQLVVRMLPLMVELYQRIGPDY